MQEVLEIDIQRLKRHPVFLKHLRWDVTPKVLFRPRYPGQGKDVAQETQGFMFYVEYAPGCPKPTLMVMKTYQLRSKTIAEVQDVPQELLWQAVKEGQGQDVAGMYPIGKALEAWLKRSLGLTETSP